MADGGNLKRTVSKGETWSATLNALADLEGLFLCHICKRQIQDPHSIGQCDHHFCKECVLSNYVKQGKAVCPECGIPCWMKDMRPNRQLSSLVNSINEIRHCLCPVKENKGQKLLADSSPSITHMEGISFKNNPMLPFKSESDDFQTPKITADLIQRHIKSKLATAVPKPSFKLPCDKQEKKEPLMKDESTYVAEYPLSPLKGDQVRNTTAKKSKMNGNLQNLRKKSCLLDYSSTSYRKTLKVFSGSLLEQPNTPLFMKTRNFAKLQTNDKRARLEALLKKNSKNKMNVSSKASSRIEPAQEEIVIRRKRRIGTRKSHTIGTSEGCKELGFFVQSSSNANTLAVKPAKVKCNRQGETQLHVATIKGNLEQVQKLLSEGATPNVKDFAGWTPLHEASNHGYMEIARELIKYGAYIDSPGYENCTPLHDAVLNEQVDIARLLLLHGANPALRNKQGLTAKDMAKSEKMKLLFVSTTPAVHNRTSKAIKSPHASPLLNGVPLDVVIMTSSLKEKEKLLVNTASQALRARMADTFSSQVTHLVTSVNSKGCCPRTMKFLSAVANGIWIVSYAWIEASLELGEWANEEIYEVKGTATSSMLFDSGGPRRSRENKALLNPGLFDGCKFYFLGSIVSPTPDKTELSELIQSCDGEVICREPSRAFNTKQTHPFHSPMPLKSSIFLLYDPNCTDEKDLEKWSKVKDLSVIPVAWILDCLSYFELNASQ